MHLQNLYGDEIYENNKYNLSWLKIKNESDSLSIVYAGKKKFFANFLSEDRRLKLKKIIEKYNSMSKWSYPEMNTDRFFEILAT